MTEIPIELYGGKVPTKATEYAGAFDVYCPCDFELQKKRMRIPLGFGVQLPVGWKANMRPRSGFSLKGMEAEVRTTYRRFGGEKYTAVEKVRVDADVILGLIDSDYRDECGVIIRVHELDAVAQQKYEFDVLVENHVFIIKDTRIAQMEVCGGECCFKVVERLNREIDRGGGYGHTGV